MRRGLLIAIAALLVAAPAAGAATLRAGAGQADITPPQTGYYLGGWTRADRTAQGASTRLFANALVLQRGERKLALVAAELFAIPAGLQEDVARKVADLGFDRTTVLLQASHTHSGPGGFFPNPTYNTAAPSTETVTDPFSFVKLFNPDPADVQLYTFLVDRITAAIRRADADRARAAAAWGHADLHGVTQNRSIEAHLANHGIHLPYGEGRPEMDPDGAGHTIDPDVDVLRVDKLGRHGRRIPIGGWSNFADHGTVVHSELQAYTGDHHASAWRTFAHLVRRHAHVPARQTVVNVYPNADEGDQTAGIAHVGPAAADWVGRQEAQAMLRAWRRAGRHLARRPDLDVRWTRTCFCGRDTATGKVDTQGREGVGFLTGSEEGRGPLYDVTGVPLEGQTNPSSDPVQGDKYVVPAGNPPPAVPITVVRIGDHALAGIPGEPTKEVGTRVKRALLEKMGSAGVRGVVIAGLADDYIQYITTPEEYGQQSYEGASTLFGVNEATFLQEQLADLGARMVAGEPAPEPYPFDPSYGVKPDGAPYPAGAESGEPLEQPEATVARLGHAQFSWRGAPSGHDLPTDRAFVSAQRRDRHGRWHTVDTDLGLDFLWRADDEGRYEATWEVPLTVPAGVYRLRVTAARYALSSDSFRVMPADTLIPVAANGVVRLRYPEPEVNVDLTARPEAARGGRVRYRLRGRTHTIRHRRGTLFAVPAGATIPVRGARDRYGNTNAEPVTVQR